MKKQRAKICRQQSKNQAVHWPFSVLCMEDFRVVHGTEKGLIFKIEKFLRSLERMKGERLNEYR